MNNDRNMANFLGFATNDNSGDAKTTADMIFEDQIFNELEGWFMVDLDPKQWMELKRAIYHKDFMHAGEIFFSKVRSDIEEFAQESADA